MSIFQLGDARPTSGGDNAAQSDDAAVTQQGTEARNDIKADLALVESIRRALQEHGYKPVLVCTGGKKPTHKNWQKGSPDAQLYPPHPRALNTGILAGEVLALDIDCDDPAIAASIEAAARRCLGDAPCRKRQNSPRRLLIYRAANPGMRKRKIGPSAAGVEILATGQQFVGYGCHPSGFPYRWESDLGPHNTPLGDLPAVTEAQIYAFLVEAQNILAAHPPSSPVAATNDTRGKLVPLLQAKKFRAADASILAGGPPTRVEQLQADAKSAAVPDMNAAAQAGLKHSWFDLLEAEDQCEALRRCVAAVSNDADSNWDFFKDFGMSIYAATAQLPDGEAIGRELFDAWSAKNVMVHNDALTAEAWREICSSPPTKKSPGTLLKQGQDAGAQLDDLKMKSSNIFSLQIQPAGAKATLPAIMDEAIARQSLNKRFAYVENFRGAPAILALDPDGSHRPITDRDLQLILAPHQVITKVRGEMRSVPAATWWIHDLGRERYDRDLYDPEGKEAKPGERILNSYRGLGVKPKPGRWGLIRFLILHVLCNGDRLCFHYLMRWLAHAVQRPGTSPGVMVVLRSDIEGVGKSTLGLLMVKIFGPHGFECTSHQQIFGSFNETLVAKSFGLLEEAGFAGDRQQAGIMRAFLTARDIAINPKNKRPFYVRNTLHLMQTSNEAWVAPAGADARRYFILDVTRKMKREFFSRLYRQIENGGREAFLHKLLSVRIGNFDPRDVPTTQALVQQQRMSADDVARWLWDCVVSGGIAPRWQNASAQGGFGQAVPGAVLHGEYLAWCQAHGIKHPKTAAWFGRALKQIGFARLPGNSAPRWQVPDAPAVLKAADAKAGIKLIP